MDQHGRSDDKGSEIIHFGHEERQEYGQGIPIQETPATGVWLHTCCLHRLGNTMELPS